MNIYFGENLKKLRKEKEITQESLADFLGITFQAVSKWERGETYPDITMLPVISRFFNISVDDLLGINRSLDEQKINEYLDRSILEIEEQIKRLPSSHEQSWDELNDVFLSILK